MKNQLVIKFREKIIKSEISQHDKVFHKSLLKVLLLCQSNLVKLQPKRVNPPVKSPICRVDEKSWHQISTQAAIFSKTFQKRY